MRCLKGIVLKGHTEIYKILYLLFKNDFLSSPSQYVL